MRRLKKDIKLLDAEFPNLSSSDQQMLEGYSTFLVARLEDFRPDVTAAFLDIVDGMKEVSPPALDIYVYTDDPAFYFQLLFEYKNQEGPRRNPHVEDFNRKISELGAIMTRDDLDPFTVWEDHPKYGKTQALNQPYYEFNLTEFVTSWFTDIISNIPRSYSGDILLSFHDSGSRVSIFP